MSNNIKNHSKEENFWLSKFGENFLERNNSYEEINKYFNLEIGIDVGEPFQKNFEELNRDISILEIGCNVGVKLEILKNMGFKNLTGIDINANALKEGKRRNPDIEFIESTIEELDADSMKYDLVFTSVVLIHQNPKTLDSIIKKIIKISKKYIFGYEYFSENLQEIEYRGNKGVLWKQNFPELFQKIEPNLKLKKLEKYKYLKKDLTDVAYLFEK